MRSIHIAVRFLVGIISITIFIGIFGYSWADVGSIIGDGLKDLIEMVGIVKRFISIQQNVM